MNILALDTATEACSAALQVGGRTLARFELAGRSHTEKLLPMVAALLAEAGIGYAQLDGYVCGIGPGSFAGVRIGVGFVKGLALAHERPVVAVSSLEMLAAPPLRSGAAPVLAAIDARMNEVYFGLYLRGAGGLPEPAGEELVCAPAEAPRCAGEAVAVGTGWGAYEAELRAATGAALRAIDGAALPRADDALTLALPRFARGETIDAAALLPRYLRNKVALTLSEQRKRSS